MILRDNIKAKVDKLDKYELRIVELLIDSLKRKKTATVKKLVEPKIYPYQQVIDLMGQHSITSDEISQAREDRI